mmetsp:Transcript_51067/g.81584  ORF Transcript_51067/g.81584 Transcript_51067/m.81584 type:complete len:197 (-) Transcript_51067:42-632(-)
MACSEGVWMMVGAARRLAVQLQQLQPNGGLLASCFEGSAAVLTTASVSAAKALTGPKYRVISVSGDGNCLFRSVAQGETATARSRRPKAEEDARSKVLRAKAVAELVKNRKELAWAIEGSFNSYVRKMSRLGEWGGEPELLMLSKVLKRPIEVYMLTPNLKKVQTYGQEFKTKTIRVLFHGYGHYSALVEVEEEQN